MYEYKAVIKNVYDGDTVRAQIKLGFGVIINSPKGNGLTLRLARINTPEVRGSSKASGYVSRDRLRELILGKDVIIQTQKDKTGKYGRYIAEIILDGENINDLLVREGLAEYKEY